jgi:hypothetical protein
MKQKLEAMSNHSTIASECDGVALLKNIKSIMYNFQSEIYDYVALDDAMRRFYFFRQDKNTTLPTYLEKLHNHVEVIEYCGGTVGVFTSLVDNILSYTKPSLYRMTCTSDQLETAEDESKERYLACVLMGRADPMRFGKLNKDMANDFMQGRNNYPKTVAKAYTLLVNWRQGTRNLMRTLGNNGNEGVAFTNLGEDEDTDVGRRNQ